ncbi:hypothetical protein TNCV_4951741 [Trichonephila clavipes]|nr:hypothetical protein TNCV_4951741 [Trichonephila clavipes]
MATGNRCMSGNTYDCRLSWTYRWAVMWCHRSILGVTVYFRKLHPIPLHQLWEWCVAVKQRQDLDVHHSSFFARGTTPKRRSRWVGVNSSTRNGRRDPKSSSAKHLLMVREDTVAPSEDATCDWMAAYEAVGCAFLTMGRS